MDNELVKLSNLTIGFNESTLTGSGTAEADDSYVPYKLRPETYVVPVIFAIIFFVGIIGNGLLIYVVLTHRSLRNNAPNLYILNLSIGDFALILISVPFTSTIYTFESWPYGEILCKSTEFFRTLSVAISVYTLTALSADRYHAIIDPLGRYVGGKRAIIRRTLFICGIIWAIAIALAGIDAYHSYIMAISHNPDDIDINDDNSNQSVSKFASNSTNMVSSTNHRRISFESMITSGADELELTLTPGSSSPHSPHLSRDSMYASDSNSGGNIYHLPQAFKYYFAKFRNTSLYANLSDSAIEKLMIQTYLEDWENLDNNKKKRILSVTRRSITTALNNNSVAQRVAPSTFPSILMSFENYEPYNVLVHIGNNGTTTDTTMFNTKNASFSNTFSSAPSFTSASGESIKKMATKTLKVCFPFPERYGERYKQIHTLAKLLLFLIVPLAIITVYYVLMAKRLIKSTTDVPCDDEYPTAGANGSQAKSASLFKASIRSDAKLLNTKSSTSGRKIGAIKTQSLLVKSKSKTPILSQQISTSNASLSCSEDSALESKTNRIRSPPKAHIEIIDTHQDQSNDSSSPQKRDSHLLTPPNANFFGHQRTTNAIQLDPDTDVKLLTDNGIKSPLNSLASPLLAPANSIESNEANLEDIKAKKISKYGIRDHDQYIAPVDNNKNVFRHDWRIKSLKPARELTQKICRGTVKLRNRYTSYRHPQNYSTPDTVSAGSFLSQTTIPLSHTRSQVNERYAHNVRLIKQMESRKKIAKMVLIFIVLFLICWLPFHIFNMWFFFNPNALSEYNYFWHTLRIVGFVLSYLNSCINPVALYFISNTFKKYFNHYLALQFLPCFKRKGKASGDGGIEAKSLPVSENDNYAIQTAVHHSSSLLKGGSSLASRKGKLKKRQGVGIKSFARTPTYYESRNLNVSIILSGKKGGLQKNSGKAISPSPNGNKVKEIITITNTNTQSSTHSLQPNSASTSIPSSVKFDPDNSYHDLTTKETYTHGSDIKASQYDCCNSTL